MATELQPPASPYNNPVPPAVPSTPATEKPSSSLAPKRHRRPSVRLGDIGDQPATLRAAKSWRLNPHRETIPNKSSKIRPLTNLVTTTTTNGNFNPHGDYSTDTATTTTATNIINSNGNPHRKFKPRRTTTSAKRVRAADLRIGELGDEERENGGNNENDAEDEIDDEEEGFRNFDPEGSEQEQQSPMNSADDVALLDAWHGHNRRSIRVAGTSATRVSDSHHELELDGFPETDSRSRGGTGLDEGVRNWLVGLGLGRYAPVFEIHEVDDEVLPYLTLEDLKDMGINAVGSRRKLYSAIQKLRKGLS